MIDKLTYSFDDQVVSAFFYDMENNRIEVHFESYYDLVKNQLIENPCVLVIEKWKDAMGKLSKDSMFDKLDNHIGVFSLILWMEKQESDLKLTVNTLDGRYIDLHFISALVHTAIHRPADD